MLRMLQELLDRVQKLLRTNRDRYETKQALERYRQRVEELTPREREVLELLIQGMSSKQIAAALDIGIRTVDTHKARVLDKIGVESVVELLNQLHQFQMLDAAQPES